jgi:hypothetical protein
VSIQNAILDPLKISSINDIKSRDALGLAKLESKAFTVGITYKVDDLVYQILKNKSN